MKVSIITMALAIVFVVTGLFAVFNTGILVKLGLDRLIGVEDCRYGVPIDREATTTSDVECAYNVNNAKRDAAQAAAIILVTLPAAYLSYRRLKV